MDKRAWSCHGGTIHWYPEMRRLSILGAGGHGQVVADAAESCGYWDEIVFFDDRWQELRLHGPWKLGGTIQKFLRTSPQDGDVIVGIGDNAVRKNMVSSLRESGFALSSVIHPTAIVSKYASIGHGSAVLAGAVINIGAVLGPACIVNTMAAVEHDCILGDGVHISTGANLAGGVIVGDESWVGAGACIRQQIKVGSRVTVGAGAVVVASIPGPATVAGNPARILVRRRAAV